MQLCQRLDVRRSVQEREGSENYFNAACATEAGVIFEPFETTKISPAAWHTNIITASQQLWKQSRASSLLPQMPTSSIKGSSREAKPCLQHAHRECPSATKFAGARKGTANQESPCNVRLGMQTCIGTHRHDPVTACPCDTMVSPRKPP